MEKELLASVGKGLPFHRTTSDNIVFTPTSLIFLLFFLLSVWQVNTLLPENKGNILNLYGNEADFLGFLQKSVPHDSLTLPFEPFRFWLQILVIEKRLADSASQGVADSPTRRVGELPIL